jgi:hypothetical protein
MKKISDLEESQQFAVKDQIQSNSLLVKSNVSESVNSLNKYGLCGGCKFFQFVESEFNIEFSKCSEFNKMILGKRPIVNCTEFEAKGSLSIRDMQSIAILTELPKDKVGF